MNEDKLSSGMIKESSMIQLKTAREQLKTAIDMISDGAAFQIPKLLMRLLNAQANLAVIEASMTLTLDNAWLWPEPPVPEILRRNLDTHYSLGHYDGPATGLITWQDQWCYVTAWDEISRGEHRKFWVCPISGENADILLAYCKAHAAEFNSMQWNRDGSRTNELEHGSLGAHSASNFIVRAKEWREAHPRPQIHQLLPKDSPIVGWFAGWVERY